MPRNASGTYTLPAGNPVAAGTLVEAAWANTTLNDLGAEMTDSLSRSGEGGMLVSFKIADGTVALPGLAFTLEPGTGLSRLGTNEFDFSVGGSRVIQLTVNGMTVTAGLAVLVDTINESTADAGVTVEGIKLKDSKIEFSDIVTIDSPVAGELALNATVVDLDATTVEFTGTTIDIDATTLDIDATTLDIDATTATVDAVTSIDLTAPDISATAGSSQMLLENGGRVYIEDRVRINHDLADSVNPLYITQPDAAATGSAIRIIHDGSGGYGLHSTGTGRPTVYMGGSSYAFYGVGGEIRTSGGGSTYLLRIYTDVSTYLNFAVRENGLIQTGSSAASAPYNNTTSSAANMNVNSNGYLRRSTSSLRFKTEVVPIEDAWADKLLELKPIFYKSAAPGDVADNDPAWTYYGFGAEDVVEVDPRFVFLKTHETTHDAETGEDTNVPLNEAIPEGVQYDRMVPALINLIKRLTARVEALEVNT